MNEHEHEHHSHFTHKETQRSGVTCQALRGLPEGHTFALRHTAQVWCGHSPGWYRHLQ